MARNGILCLEGDWEEGLLQRRSLLPVLHLVRSQWNIPFIHRTASTRDEFRRVIHEWLKFRYASYPILYLGFHGYPGALAIGSEEIPICDLAEFAGRGHNRIIHFGACDIFKAPRHVLRRFLDMTGFLAICGFRDEVDWLHCCALEIIILDQLSRRKISGRNIRVFQKNLTSMAGTLARYLNFQVWDRSSLGSVNAARVNR
ncbi:MAG: hypothetical protein HY537_02620 [Deltaproteobacteria bacterium]|nr:hypothetical protein [Deltaproteobacteria bacterium]